MNIERMQTTSPWFDTEALASGWVEVQHANEIRAAITRITAMGGNVTSQLSYPETCAQIPNGAGSLHSCTRVTELHWAAEELMEAVTESAKSCLVLADHFNRRPELAAIRIGSTCEVVHGVSHVDIDSLGIVEIEWAPPINDLPHKSLIKHFNVVNHDAVHDSTETLNHTFQEVTGSTVSITKGMSETKQWSGTLSVPVLDFGANVSATAGSTKQVNFSKVTMQSYTTTESRTYNKTVTCKPRYHLTVKVELRLHWSRLPFKAKVIVDGMVTPRGSLWYAHGLPSTVVPSWPYRLSDILSEELRTVECAGDVQDASFDDFQSEQSGYSLDAKPE